MNALPNAGRREKNFGGAPAPVKKVEPAAINGGGSFLGQSSAGDTEEDKIAAMFQASSEQWNKTQEHMAKCVYSFEYDGLYYFVILYMITDVPYEFFLQCYPHPSWRWRSWIQEE